MALPVDDNQSTASENTARRRSIGAALGLVAAGVLILGTGYYAYTARSDFESRIADLDQSYSARLAEQIHAIREETSALTTDVAAVTKGLEDVTRETDAARVFARALKRADDRTASTLTTQTADITAIRHDAAMLATDMATRIDSVSTELNKVAGGLAGARNDVGDNRRQITALKAEVGEQIANNTRAVAELRRLGEHQWFEFDVLKSSRPASPRVADVRIQLAKTDVRKAKYDVVLHFDDRQIERKDLTIGEPVQFLVGSERRRYELVVTDMERDRIRGYLSVSNVGAIGTKQVAVH